MFFFYIHSSPLTIEQRRCSQKTCEAAARKLQVGPDIHTKCTGAIKENDLLLKKPGDYLLEEPPLLHFHCAKRDFDIEV